MKLWWSLTKLCPSPKSVPTLLFVLLMTTTPGCSSERAADKSAITPPSGPATFDTSTPISSIALAIADNPNSVAGHIGLGGRESATLFDTTQRLNQACMRAKGFEVPADTYGPVDAEDIESSQDYRRHRSGGASEVDAWIEANPQAGVEFNACDEETEQAVYGPGGYLGLIAPVGELYDAIEGTVASSAAQVQLDLDWSACMEAAGHSFDTADEPWQQPWMDASPSVKEIETRRADLACRAKVDYSRRHATIAAQSITLLDDGTLAARVEAIRSDYSAAVRRAVTLLEANPGKR